MIVMKKIAIITSGFAPVPAIKGGAVEMLTTFLIDQNETQHLFEIDLYTIADTLLEGINYQHTRIIQIRVSRIEHFMERVINKLFHMSKINRNLFFYEKKVEFDIDKKKGYEYVLFENAMSLFAPIRKLLGDGPNYIFHMHNDFNSNSKTKKMGIEIASMAYRILSVSQYINDRFIDVTNCQNEKCRILYNCKKIELLIKNEKCVNAIKSKWGINNNDFVFLYVGRINEEKGVLELAKAFKKFKGNAKLVICGGTWGTEFRKNKYLSNVIKTLDNKICSTIFTGYINEIDMKKFYSIADCVVIPTICQEAYGMVMLESLNYGIPIIATKSGGMTEIALKNEVDWINIDNQMVDNLLNALTDNYENSVIKKERAILASFRIKKELQFNENGYLNRFCKEINYYE